MFAPALALALAPADQVVSTCAWATAADISGLRIRHLQDEATETPSPKRYDPEPDGFQHMFAVEVYREARGPKCLLVRWRAVPRGKPAASAADFFGGRWPGGIIELPAWPTARNYNEPRVEIRFSPRDDGIAEPNELLGLELLDRNGRVIWGSEIWAPGMIGRSVVWDNDGHRGGFMFTIHDAGRQCSAPGPKSGFTIVSLRATPQERQYASWPALYLERPNRPITQCEIVRWRLAPGGTRSLRAADFPNGVFPTGTLRFNSFATGGPDDQDALKIPLVLRRGVAGRGRTVTVIVESERGLVAQRTLTLD